MRWRKLGRIFDPTHHDLAEGCVDFAQSPQALVCDNLVRIYFSTRRRDDSGKFLSHVAYVDMTLDLTRVLAVSSKPVIPLGELGTFDEHGIFPFNVVRKGGCILGYTGGWTRRASVSVDGAIGLAVSEDGGLTFKKAGPGPVLAASLHEPFLVGDPFVNCIDGLFHMWYIFGTRWIPNPVGGPLERVYKIGHATSPEGVKWTKDERGQAVPDRLNADECQALPTVARFGDTHHMFFCYREAIGFRTDPSRAYRIGHAFSHDLETWTRDDAGVGIDVSSDGWDSQMMCYPHVFRSAGKTYLLYNGNEFGRWGFGAAVAEEEAP